MTDKESLIVRLRLACVGHPTAQIPWPHRILHEAADELTAANARITELEALLGEIARLSDYASTRSQIGNLAREAIND